MSSDSSKRPRRQTEAHNHDTLAHGAPKRSAFGSSVPSRRAPNRGRAPNNGPRQGATADRMRQRPSAGRMWAIMRKDITLFARDRLFIFLTILSVTVFVVLYWVLPREVDETITVGVHGEEIRMLIEAGAAADVSEVPGGEESAEEGFSFSWYDSSASLRQAVVDRELEVGIDFPEGFAEEAAAGRKTAVSLYIRQNLPEAVRRAMSSMVREIVFALAGYELPVTEPEEDTVILGRDRAGNQIPLREKLKPLYAFMVLIMEAVALGTLISSEIQQRTITAILSTSTRLRHVLGAKILLGTCIAFAEGVAVMLLVRGFGASPGVVLTALFLGAVLVTGVAMITGSAGKSFVGTMLISLLFLIPLAVPAFAVIFPGSPGLWMELIPSYGLVKAVSVSAIEGGGWLRSLRYVGALAGWGGVIVFLGAIVLKRRVDSL